MHDRSWLAVFVLSLPALCGSVFWNKYKVSLSKCLILQQFVLYKIGHFWYKVIVCENESLQFSATDLLCNTAGGGCC